LKIYIKLLFLTILFSEFIFSKITVSINPKIIIRGNQADFVITAYGDNIGIPNIKELGGFPIVGISTESFYNNINGKVSQGKKIHYSFSPDKNTTIQPITLNIDGNIEITPLTEIKVVKPSFKEIDPFQIKLTTKKKDYYLGETIKVEVEYSEKLSQDVIDRRYSEPKGKYLWLKYKAQAKDRQENNNYLINFNYFFTPQKIGEVEINSAKMRIGTRLNRRDSWGIFFESAKWHNIISNSLKLNIINSPTKYIGDFNISVKTDKNEVKSGEAVNVTLTIVGNGNLEDFTPFKMNLTNGIVYDEKPNIENKIISKNYQGFFTQKFAVILDKNDSIPSFEIQFFNPQINKMVKKISAQIPITVLSLNNNLQNHKLNVIRADEVSIKVDKNQPKAINYINLFVSFFSGVILTMLFILTPFKKFKIWKRVKSVLNRDKTLLKKLLPYIYQNHKILNIANSLEKRIYHNKKIKISKKDIKSVLLLIESKELKL